MKTVFDSEVKSWSYVWNKSGAEEPMEYHRQPSDFSIDNLLCEPHQTQEQSSGPESTARWTNSDTSKYCIQICAYAIANPLSFSVTTFLPFLRLCVPVFGSIAVFIIFILNKQHLVYGTGLLK